jgi:SAM-dependent methyltransferase
VIDRRAVAAGYDAAADGYDQRHGDRPGRARAAAIDRVLLGACRGATRVLEVGVGTGRLLAQVDAPVRIGLDVAPRMLAVARGRGLTVVCADGAAVPFAAGSFDAVIAGKGALRYLAPAVAHGLWQPASTAELIAAVAAAGFTVERIARWRSIRVWPYALAIPAAVDDRAPVQLWSHVAVVARR